MGKLGNEVKGAAKTEGSGRTKKGKKSSVSGAAKVKRAAGGC
jgi:hypothetical protein